MMVLRMFILLMECPGIFVNGDLKIDSELLADKIKNIFNESGLMVYWKDEEPYRLSNLAYKNLGEFEF